MLEGRAAGRVLVDDVARPGVCHILHPHGMALLVGEPGGAGARDAILDEIVGAAWHRDEWLQVGSSAWANALSAQEKRRLLEFVCSNFLLDAGELTPVYRKPIDVIASAASMAGNEKRSDPLDPTAHSIEYPERDNLRTLVGLLREALAEPQVQEMRPDSA